ncbi:unnamed protein product [Rotaria sp. Silwood1]|nr:unnamed protein product [Rotaria sp. Silwood1]
MTDSTQIKFDSFSMSFISGAIIFRNVYYIIGSYFIFVKDGCLVFRYSSKTKTKPIIRLKIKLFHLDLHFLVLYVQSRISAEHDTLPYGLFIRFSTTINTFTSTSSSKNASEIDLMAPIYSLKYRNLRIRLYPIRSYDVQPHQIPPPILTSKTADSGIFQVLECSDDELEYEQDTPGKMIELSDNSEPLPDLTWEFRIKCPKEPEIAYRTDNFTIASPRQSQHGLKISDDSNALGSGIDF